MVFTVKKKWYWMLFIIMFSLWAPAYSHAKQEDKIPYPARVVLHKAHIFLEKKEISKAIEVLESFRAKGGKALKAGVPDRKGYRHHLIDFFLGNCYLMSDRLQKAASYYNSAVNKKPDFSPAWLNLGKCYCDLNKHAEAGICFLKGYDMSKEKKPEILYYSAASFMIADDNKKALEVFERLLASHENKIKIEWKESLVQAYLACEMPRKALPFVKELAIKTSGKKKKQWQEVLLHQYLSLNMKTKALDYAERLTREDPLEPKWWKSLVHLHLMENRYKKGLVALTVYSFLTPLSEQEKKLMADLNLNLGIPIQAARFYEEILSKKMEPETIKKIAQSYRSLHRPQGALKWVEKGLQQSLDKDLLMLKANLLYEMKKYQEAMAAFESAVPKSKNPGQALLMLGYSAWNAGDLKRARQAFKKAAKYPKQKSAARKFLRRLEKTASR